VPEPPRSHCSVLALQDSDSRPAHLAGLLLLLSALLRDGSVDICPRLALPEGATARRLPPDVLVVGLGALHGVTVQVTPDVSAGITTAGMVGGWVGGRNGCQRGERALLKCAFLARDGFANKFARNRI